MFTTQVNSSLHNDLTSRTEDREITSTKKRMQRVETLRRSTCMFAHLIVVLPFQERVQVDEGISKQAKLGYAFSLFSMDPLTLFISSSLARAFPAKHLCVLVHAEDTREQKHNQNHFISSVLRLYISGSRTAMNCKKLLSRFTRYVTLWPL